MYSPVDTHPEWGLAPSEKRNGAFTSLGLMHLESLWLDTFLNSFTTKLANNFLN